MKSCRCWTRPVVKNSLKELRRCKILPQIPTSAHLAVAPLAAGLAWTWVAWQQTLQQSWHSSQNWKCHWNYFYKMLYLTLLTHFITLSLSVGSERRTKSATTYNYAAKWQMRKGCVMVPNTLTHLSHKTKILQHPKKKIKVVCKSQTGKVKKIGLTPCIYSVSL